MDTIWEGKNKCILGIWEYTFGKKGILEGKGYWEENGYWVGKGYWEGKWY